MSNQTELSREELIDALRYALHVIDDVAALAGKGLSQIPAPQQLGNGMPDTAAESARMLHRADLRQIQVHGPSNVAALRAIVDGKPATPWFNPIADVRARLAMYR